MQNSPSCECCPEEELEGCLIGVDDFDRGDNIDVGPDWVEEEGDWEISSNTVLTESSDAILKFDTPTPTVSQLLTVDVTISDEGGQARIYLGYVDATTNLSILLETGMAGTGSSTAGGGCGVFSLYSGGSLLHTIPALGLVAGETVAVTGYYDSVNGLLWAKYSTQGGIVRLINESVAATGGFHAALGTGTLPTGNVQFDNFQLSQATDFNETGTGSGTIPGAGCPGIYDCSIHGIADESGQGCDASISGTPFAAAAGTGTGDAWSISSLVTASDADRGGARFGMTLIMTTQDTTSAVTLSLGGYSATFTRLISPNRTKIDLGATSQTFTGHELAYCLGIAAGVVSANINGGGVHIAQTGTPGDSASASGTDGQVAEFHFSRCIACIGLACSSCSPQSAEVKSVTFTGNYTGCVCPDPWPGSLVMVYVPANQIIPAFAPPNAAYGGNNWISYCLWGPKIASAGSDPECAAACFLYLITLNDNRKALLFRATRSSSIAGKQWIKFYSPGDPTPCGSLDGVSLSFLSTTGSPICIDTGQPVFVYSD